MGHVLILSIGPVQDFIASARRSRDLWFGSWLLSELSKAIGFAMVRACGFESLVFPGVARVDALLTGSPTSVANKIVVRVPDGIEPADLASRARAALEERLGKIRDKAFERIQDKVEGGPYFIEDRAREQLSELIELAWASAPESSPDGYQAARKETEALLAARFNTRLWKSVGWGDTVPKSSLDGLRESVLHESLFERVQQGLTSPEEIRKRYGVGASERLCGVGLLKRHGQKEGSRYEHRFLSTGHLAAWPLLEHLSAMESKDAIQRAWSRYIGILQSLEAPLEEWEVPRDRNHEVLGLYDGSLLFEGRLTELFEGVLDRNERRRRTTDARKALADFLRGAEVQAPVNYYAILLADGDRMGEAIDRQASFEDHKALSQKLDEFARGARDIVEADHHGELIYSGGDDVLAFVPLHRAVRCARQLAERFAVLLEPFGTPESRPTLSVGIGISHFMDPMGQALHLARSAEKLAKQTRNALAVIVDKRSGPAIEVSGIWGTVDQDLDVFVEMHVEDWVPDGAAYELRELGTLLDGATGEAETTLKDLVRKEAERILRRKQPAHGAKAEIAANDMDYLRPRLAQEGIPAIADRLIIARLLAEAQVQAHLPTKGEAP
jgi:CRISPR-associated protein Cmr2